MRDAYKGSTSHSEFFVLRDSTTGLGKTGLVYTDITGSYTRARAARTAITMATLGAANSAYSSGGFIEVDSANCPGLYRHDVPDAAYATGVDNMAVTLKATGVITEHKEFRLVDYNSQDGVRMGLSALPNAAAGASGGLPLSVDASGRVDVLKVNGTSQTARDIGASVLLSSGSGTGQLDFTSGVVKANLAQILGTALTETAGFLAAGFKKFFNIASPALTVAGIDQTGDSYARLGAPAGASIGADIAAIKSDSGAIKTKTDNLPPSPAAVGDIPTVAEITDQIATDHGSGSYVRNTEPDNTGIGVAVAAAAAAATNSTDLPSMIEASGGHNRYKATALEQAPSGGGGGGGDATLDNQVLILADTAAIKAKTDLITTGTAISIVASVSIIGGTITARAGDSWLIAINGLGDISDAAKLWFSINGLGNDDADSKLFVEKTAGLTVVNGEAYTTPSDGQLTVDDATLGNIRVNVQEVVTKGISLPDKPWTVKMLTTSGDTRTLATGDFRILKYGVSAIT